MKSELDIALHEGAQALLDKAEIARVVEAVLAHEGIERPCGLSLSFVSDEEIAALNEEWRGIARPTDVLSFELESPYDEDLAPGELVELGDIVLASNYVCEQAQSYGTTARDECTLLLVHGMLHLLGYDHETDEDAARMQSIEDELLATIDTDGSIDEHVLVRHREEEDA